MLRNSGKKIPLFTEVKINKPKNKINLKKKPFNSIKYSQRFGHTVNPYKHNTREYPWQGWDGMNFLSLLCSWLNFWGKEHFGPTHSPQF